MPSNLEVSFYDSLRRRMICGPINVAMKVDNNTLKGVIRGAGAAHMATSASGVRP